MNFYFQLHAKVLLSMTSSLGLPVISLLFVPLHQALLVVLLIQASLVYFLTIAVVYTAVFANLKKISHIIHYNYIYFMF